MFLLKVRLLPLDVASRSRMSSSRRNLVDFNFRRRLNQKRGGLGLRLEGGLCRLVRLGGLQRDKRGKMEMSRGADLEAYFFLATTVARRLACSECCCTGTGRHCLFRALIIIKSKHSYLLIELLLFIKGLLVIDCCGPHRAPTFRLRGASILS